MSDAENPPWVWPEPVWRGVVEEVRTGGSLTPASWPGGAPAASALSSDADHETPALRDGNTSPGVLAAGEFGSRVAVSRILDLLARHEVPASFHVPAVSALLHPDDVRRSVVVEPLLEPDRRNRLHERAVRRVVATLTSGRLHDAVADEVHAALLEAARAFETARPGLARRLHVFGEDGTVPGTPAVLPPGALW